jgi:uncharacterized caspase-like protein
MSRIAVVIANSVTSQPIQKGMGASSVRRTASILASMLSKLPGKYAFDARQVVDEKPTQVRKAIDAAAAMGRKDNELLLVYYFGHARREGDDLAFVHPGKKGQRDYLAFSTVFHTVMVHAPQKVVYILDCCYAGAAARQFDLLPERRHFLMACTTASTRAWWEENRDTPLGYFTGALIDGLSGPEATVSHADDSITAESLFNFARRETKRLTAGRQDPYSFGNLRDTLSVYSPRPPISPGLAGSPTVTIASLRQAFRK